MSAPSHDTPVTTSASGYEDGFGRRLLAFTPEEDAAAVERLILRPQFSVYERALGEAFARLAGQGGGRIVAPQTLERAGPSGTLVATSPFVSGERLADLLETAAERARDGETVSGIDVAIGFLLDVLPALGELRSATGLSHGAIASSRCVFTPDGAVVLTECGFAAVLQRINPSRDRLWKEFGVAIPPMAGAPRFDETGDVSQAALLALMLMVGRPLIAVDPLDVLPEWLSEAVEIAQIRGSVTFSVGLQRFLQRALPLPGRRPYQTIDAALLDVRPMGDAIGEAACRTALAEFVRAASGTVAAPTAWPLERVLPEVEPAPEREVYAPPEPARIQPVAIEEAPIPWEQVAIVPEPIPVELVPNEPAPLAFAEFESPEEPIAAEAPASEAVPIEPSWAEPIPPDRNADVTVRETTPSDVASLEPVERPQFEPLAAEPEPEPHPIPAPTSRKRWRARRTDRLRSALTPPKPEPAPTPIAAPAPVPERVVSPPPLAPFIERPAAALVPLVPLSPPMIAPVPVVVSPASLSPAPSAPGLVVPPVPAAPVPPQPVFTPLAAPVPEKLWVPPAVTTPLAPVAPKPQPVAIAPAPLKLKVEPQSPFTSRASRHEQPRDVYPSYIERSAHATASGGLGRALKVAAAAAVVIGGLFVAGRTWGPDSPSVIAEAPRTEPVTVAAPPPVTTGTLVVQTQPAGARVLLDGSAVGETPVRIVDVAPGRHVLTLITPTATVRRTVRVEANKELTVDVPVFSGWVAIFAPIVLEVSEDGRAIGTTDQGRLLLPPGRHTLTLTNQDFGYSADHVVEIEAGEVRSLNLQPTGTVNLNAVPWAEVWIDGKKAGETPIANLKLPIGNREIVFKHPEFGERKMMTRVTGGEPIAVSVDLSR
jgi:hypothetical protein